ncbi:MAG TPA: hypothetical protein HPP56_07760 [Nitrospirae bacterium]|nr:hypothetical protein [Nitrospirota bacterium]
MTKPPRNFFYKVSYKIFHQPFILDFVKFSVLLLILGFSKPFNITCYCDILTPLCYLKTVRLLKGAEIGLLVLTWLFMSLLPSFY